MINVIKIDGSEVWMCHDFYGHRFRLIRVFVLVLE